MPSPPAAARLDWVADRCLRALWKDGPEAYARVRAAMDALGRTTLPALLDLVPAYPQATPGGWVLLGRTPRVLFDAHRPQPALLEPGDSVRFRPISHAEHETLRAEGR